MNPKKALEEQIEKLDQQIEETRELLRDPSYKGMAEVEINRLKEERAALEESLEGMSAISNQQLAISNENSNYKDVILEIRAAAGGEESALFAADLARMYEKFAESQKWKITEIEKIETGIGGLKQGTFQISSSSAASASSAKGGYGGESASGGSPYSLLKYESGVHRVQRVPKTEKSGRIHTSTITVAVLPQVEEKEIEIGPNDLRIEAFRSSGPGGQHMQKNESAVRITHIPTGITASSQQARHQLANKELAMGILRARVYEYQQSTVSTQQSALRKEQIGEGARSEKIRTYNFPQNRITDHRIKKSWHNLENILNGELQPIIEELATQLELP